MSPGERPLRIEPGPGQESVWDYPRPPRLERTTKRLVVVFGGVIVADTVDGHRVLETSQPAAYYFPEANVDVDRLVRSGHRTYCEWKGAAQHWDLNVGGAVAREAAWSYPEPTPAFSAIAGHVAFYPGRVDGCSVDGAPVTPMDGGFYGGWITADVVGPFKGAPGTLHW